MRINTLSQEILEETIFFSLKKELDLTPKPGLVDKNNSGSHNDMDYNLMLKSAETIAPVLSEIFYINSKFDFEEQFFQMREIGKFAEKKMFSITNNVNTHKGAVFLLGTSALVLSYLYHNKIEFSFLTLTEIIQKISYSELKRDFNQISEKKTNLTYGEKAFIELGIKGARGFVFEGMKPLFYDYLPMYKKLSDISETKAGIHTLIHIISKTDDTNILHRKNHEWLAKIYEICGSFILNNDVKNVTFIDKAKELDDFFIQNNISPGGAADILALIYFFDRILSKFGERFEI